MRFTPLWLVPILVLAGACADEGGPTSPPTPPSTVAHEAPAPAEQARLERLARRTAMALRDPAFREEVRASLDGSPFREHKLQFQRFLKGPGAHGGPRPMAALAAAGAEPENAVGRDADEAMGLEFYFPVHGQREAWNGDENILVATAINDHDVPVAFDTRGRRHLLDPDHPPTTPVLAVEPQELNFDAPPAKAMCSIDTCDNSTSTQQPSGGGDGLGNGSTLYPSAPPPGIHMSYVQFNETFEGWLKGDPEFEIHILGPSSAGDNNVYNTVWCVGEHGDQYWDLNGTTWQGDLVIYTQSQLDAFHAKYPGQPYSILALEDDDTACQVKVGQDHVTAFVNAVNSFTNKYKGARDALGLNGKTLSAAQAFWSLIQSAINLIKTNDDLIGAAVANTVTGYSHPIANWAFIGYDQGRYGWIRLDLK